MKKKILKFTPAVAILTIACYGVVNAYCEQKKVTTMSDLLLQNVEALAEEGGDDSVKPKKQYVYVVKKSGICCKIMPSGYPGRPNEKVKTGNTWQTCKRELMNENNKNSNCTPKDCPEGEMPYYEP